VIAWERSWQGGDQGGRYGTITLGVCLGTGVTGEGIVEDVDYTVDAETTAVPVNAFALELPAYAVMGVDVANDADAQVALALAELADGKDPTNALAAAIPKINIQLRPLTSVATIERKIEVTAELLDSPMGYDAGAD